MFFPKASNAAKNPSDTVVLLHDDPRLPATPVMATIGRASFRLNDEGGEETNLIPRMIEAGMNIVRINLAHVYTLEDKQWVSKLLEAVSSAAQEAGRPVAVSVDLAGPKIRIGRVRTPNSEGDEDYVEFAAEDRCVLTTDPGFGITSETYGEKTSKLSLKTDGMHIS